jgi:predicted Zn finger-like uncharacterized protein
MRLVCPNCDAQYEVDAAAIPDAGRDVQCSNCGHAWFQMHPDAEAEAELAAPAVAEAVKPPAPQPVGIVEAEDAAEADEMPPPLPAAGANETATPIMPPLRRAVDDSVLAVLREEAEREAAVRKTEPPRPVEVQADLGLQQVPVPASVIAARERFKDLSPETDDLFAEDSAAKPASRRELLPDIEEINSTLRASSEPRGGAEAGDMALAEQPEDRRKGFRSGFVLMILIAVGLWMTYVMAPRIVQNIPASEAALQGYVATVNKARLGVDSALQSASKSLRTFSGQDS